MMLTTGPSQQLGSSHLSVLITAAYTWCLAANSKDPSISLASPSSSLLFLHWAVISLAVEILKVEPSPHQYHQSLWTLPLRSSILTMLFSFLFF